MTKNKKIVISICAVVLSIVIVACGIYFFAVILPKQIKQKELQKTFEEYYNGKVASFEEQNKTLTNVDVAFVGDSLTDGYDLNTFYPQYNVVNRGISGDTTFGVENRLKVSLFDITPKVVVMLIGGNNYQTMFENYESILQKFKTNLPGSHIVLLSLTALGQPYANLNSAFQQNNTQIETLAEQYQFEFVDVFTPLCDQTTGEIFPQYTTDGVHLTSQGYQVLTNCITPVLQTLL